MSLSNELSPVVEDREGEQSKKKRRKKPKRERSGSDNACNKYSPIEMREK